MYDPRCRTAGSCALTTQYASSSGHRGWRYAELAVSFPSDYGVWESVVSSLSGVRGGATAENAFWHIFWSQNTSDRQKCDFFARCIAKSTYLYDVSDLNVSNVSDRVKDGEAIICRGLWGTGPFIRGGHSSFVGGGAHPTL